MKIERKALWGLVQHKYLCEKRKIIEKKREKREIRETWGQWREKRQWASNVGVMERVIKRHRMITLKEYVLN